MRIAIISPTFGAYGGLEAFCLELARCLKTVPAVEVRLFFKRTARFALRPELQAAASRLGECVHFVDRGGLQLRAAIAWADVVHGQNLSPDVMLWAKIARRPLLFTVHAHRAAGRSWRQRLWDFCLRRADKRFYVSSFVRRTWEGATPWPNGEVVFPFCELANGSVPPTQRRGFVFAARWIANKGLDTLVEAYGQAGLDPVSWPLVLIGDGPLRQEIVQQVSALGLRGVEMPGFISQAAKADAIRSSKWMVVPPHTNEDFGLTAIEARHLGVPCIITRDGGVPEAAGDDALACEPRDVAGLAACLRAAAGMSETEYERRASRTRETLLPRLASGDFYARAYRELLNERGQR